MNANWFKELTEINKADPIIGIAVKGKLYGSVQDAREVLDYDFDSGYGGTEGPCFTAWSNERVYFPGCYDGAEWITNVPRNPCEDSTEHIGGG